MRGSCLCGAIRYSVNAPLGPVTACHCKQCRRMTGHYSAATPVKWSDLTIEGDLRWYESSPGARRGFCPTCGSYLVWEEHDGLAYLSAGTLDGPTGLSMDGHIYYAFKGDYYRAEDGLPCWAEERSGPKVAP